jgi:hypothetical protein
MNLKEINIWIKNATYVDETHDFPDSCGNEDSTEIYTVGDDPQLWALDYTNGHLCEKWGEHGWIRDVYEPYKVKAETRVVTVTEYISEDE